MSGKETMFDLNYDEEKEAVFTQAEVADILNITQSAVSQAASAGTIGTRDVGKRMPKIPASEVIAYAKKIGRDPEKIQDRIQNRTTASLGEVTIWALVGFGLYKVLKQLIEG